MKQVAIADDEEPARTRIRSLLKSRNGIEVVAECADGKTTLGLLSERRLDLLFLDIQMPVLDGFEVIAEASSAGIELPPIIFATAYDEHAVRAFDVAAIDYLLKPFSDDRFYHALDRAPCGDSDPEDLQRLLGTIASPKARLPVKDGEVTTILRIKEISHIEAAGNYVEIHCGGKTFLHRETMASMEGQLMPHGFFRASRSFLVNFSAIVSVQTPRGSRNLITLQGGAEIPVTVPVSKLEEALRDWGG